MSHIRVLVVVSICSREGKISTLAGARWGYINVENDQIN